MKQALVFWPLVVLLSPLWMALMLCRIAWDLSTTADEVLGRWLHG